MKNVTITLEEEVARWARIRAAIEDTSVSRLVGQMLKEEMVKEENYQKAMERYLQRKPGQISKSGKYPKREELYDRKGLR